jgi:hypothetical protein
MAKKKAATQASNGNRQATPGIRSNKVQAVKDCLDRGMESPSAIADTLKEQGIEITPAYVSLIKGKHGKKKKGKYGRKRATAATQPAAPIKKATTNGAGLAPRDLVELAALADRAGGVERLKEYLEVLKTLR